MTTITIPGKPFAKQRPRFSRKSGGAYTPTETVSFESTVRALAVRQFEKPMEGPVRLTVYATFQTPKSWTRKKTAALIHRCHTQKPDLDNIVKAISDGMNRVAYADDSQIAETVARKMWGNTAQTVVIVEPV